MRLKNQFEIFSLLCILNRDWRQCTSTARKLFYYPFSIHDVVALSVKIGFYTLNPTKLYQLYIWCKSDLLTSSQFILLLQTAYKIIYTRLNEAADFLYQLLINQNDSWHDFQFPVYVQKVEDTIQLRIDYSGNWNSIIEFTIGQKIF